MVFIETAAFTKLSDDEIWLITLYAKHEASSIARQVLKKIAEEIKHG